MSDEPELEIARQVDHWRKGASESWEDAEYLLKGKRILLGLFAVHLALEKVLKAHIWPVKRKMPPHIHNLTRLAEIAEIPLDDQNKKVLAEINEFNIEGRCSDVLGPPYFSTGGKRLSEKSTRNF